MPLILSRLVPFVYVVLLVYLVHDCYTHRREPFWYLLLLLPGWGPGLYIWKFKF